MMFKIIFKSFSKPHHFVSFSVILFLIYALQAVNANKADMGDLYPKVQSFKAKIIAKTFSNGKESHVMDGVEYFRKGSKNNFYTKSELTWKKDNNTSKSVVVFDGRFTWSYIPEFNLVIKDDSVKFEEIFFKSFGFQPHYITEESLVYEGIKLYRGETVKKYVIKAPKKLKEIEPGIDSKKEFLVGADDGIIRAASFFDEKNQVSFQIEVIIESKDIELEESLFHFEPPEGVTIWSIPDEERREQNWTLITSVFFAIVCLLLAVFYRYFIRKRKSGDTTLNSSQPKNRKPKSFVD